MMEKFLTKLLNSIDYIKSTEGNYPLGTLFCFSKIDCILKKFKKAFDGDAKHNLVKTLYSI